MKAKRMCGPGKSELVDQPMPVPGENDVILKVLACGVCASELHFWAAGKGGRDGVFGHEVVGIVEKLGKNVAGFAPGDRVTGLIWGGFAEYTFADSRLLVKVPTGLTDEEAIGEPLSCLVSAAERTPIALGDTVGVVGLGFMGLGMLQLARCRGAARLVAVDVRGDALDAAKKFGADEALEPAKVPDAYKVTDWPHIGRGLPAVIESSGSPPGLALAGDMVAVSGALSIVGWHQNGPRSVNMELWNWKSITVINAHERSNEKHCQYMRAGMALIEKGLFDMKGMITHRYPLAGVDDAYRALLEKPAGFIKAVVFPQEKV